MKLITSVLLILQLSQLIICEKVVTCYWGTWSNYRPGDGKLEASNIDPFVCTHIVYSFMGLGSNNEIKSLDTWLDDGLHQIQQVMDLKKKNPKLKILVAMGGWNEGSTKYSDMAADSAKINTFVQSVVAFLQKYGFDGFDLDWEYPADRGGRPEDRVNLITLLSKLRAALKSSGKLLSIAVGASAEQAKKSYDIAGISKNVDFIHMMSYDYHMATEPTLAFNAPYNEAEASIKYWLDHGASNNKLVLGIATYGRCNTLANSAQTTPGSPSGGDGSPGPYTKQPGYKGYNEICTSGWTKKFDQANGCPYVYQGNQWCGYDDPQSVGLKMKIVKKYNLPGAFVWALETDDFRGKCGQKYPLLKAIRQGVTGSVDSSNDSTAVEPDYTEQQPEPAPEPESKPAPGAPRSNNVDCLNDGYFANPSDCGSFILCSGGNKNLYQCPGGLHFDVSTKACNWPQLANCSV